MLWTTTQQFHPWPFEKEIELETAITEIKHDLFGNSRVYLEVKKLIGQPRQDAAHPGWLSAGFFKSEKTCPLCR